MKIMKEKIAELLLKSVDTVLLWMFYLVVYFAPTKTALLTIGFFVFCDAVTGILASRAKEEPFTSRKLRRTIAKFLAYGIGILVSHVVQVNLLPTMDCVKIIAGLIAFTELKSIDENIKVLTGFSMFKFILEKLKPKS
jgi:hypothetical protein